MQPSPPDRGGSAPGGGVAEIAEGARHTIVGEAGGRGMEVLGRVLLTRMMGAADYGAFALALLVTDVAALCARLGFDYSIVYHVSRLAAAGRFGAIRRTVHTAARVVAAAGIAVAAALFFWRADVALRLLGKPETLFFLGPILLAAPAIGLVTVYGRALQGLGRIREFQWVFRLGPPLLRLAVIGTLFAAVGLAGGSRRLAAHGAVCATVASYAGAALLGFWLFRRRCPAPAAAEPGLPFRQVFVFALPVFFEVVWNFVITWTDKVMLGLYHFSVAEIGFYDVAAMWGNAPIFGLNCLIAVFSPVIGRLHAEGRREELERLFKTVARWETIFAFAAFALLALFTPEILRLHGTDFPAGAFALVFLAGGQLVNGATGPVGTMLLMTGRPFVSMVNSILLGLLNIGLNVVLIPRHGAAGAAAASALSMAAINLVRLLEVRLLVGIHPYDRSFLPPILAVGGAALAVGGWRALFPGAGSAVATAGGLAIFAAALIALFRAGCVRAEDKVLWREIQRSRGRGVPSLPRPFRGNGRKQI